MRVRLSLVLIALIWPVAALAQDNPVRVLDGGIGRGTLESIFIPPMAHAPFGLVLTTEWSRPMNNGGTFTEANRRRIMRDAKGRIYQERWLLVPKGSKIKSEMNVIQISDPAEQTTSNCMVAEKTCYMISYNGSTNVVYKPVIGVSGPLPSGNGTYLHEDLGTSSTAGVNTTGYRETTTLNPGVLGNDQPMVTVREFWFSAELGINLISKLDNPQTGRQTFIVTELGTSEPDPHFFTLPEGYKVVDERKGVPPQ